MTEQLQNQRRRKLMRDLAGRESLDDAVDWQ
jgi:hypothetical protein